MAPEIIKGRGYGLEADWWALGVLTYEMLVGDCPFEGETQVEVFKRIMTTPRQVHFPPGLPADAVAFVQQLLVGAPSRRLGDASAHDHAFIATLDRGMLLAKELEPPAACTDAAVVPAVSPADADAAAPHAAARCRCDAAPPAFSKRAAFTDEEASSSSATSDDEQTPLQLPDWADFEPRSDEDGFFCGFTWAGPMSVAAREVVLTDAVPIEAAATGDAKLTIADAMGSNARPVYSDDISMV
jgi:serine/threonine protein kinase